MSIFKHIRNLILGPAQEGLPDDMASDELLELPEDEHLQALCQQALEHHKNGELRQAEHLYRQILKHDENHADTLHLLGLIAYQQGKLGEAIALMNQALNQKPQAWHVHNNLGNVLRDKGKPREAIAHYQQALKLKPEFAEAENNLGNAWSTLEQYDQAIEHYQKAVALAPAYLAAHNNLGNAYLNILQFEAAIAQYQAVLKINPDFAIAHNNLGNIYNTLGQPEMAIRHYQAALQLDPNLAETYNNLGTLLQSLGRIEEAVPVYQRGLALKPHFPEIHYNLGNIALQQDQRSQAVDHYQAALKAKPDYIAVHLQLAHLFSTQGLPDMARRHVNKALELKPQAAEVQLALARLLQAEGRFDQAREALESFLEAEPQQAEAHLALAHLLLLQGRWPEGFAELEWRKRHPAYPLALPQPEWDGTADLQGKLLLLCSDSSLEDAVQCLRYVPELAQRGARILLEVPRLLASLASTVPGIEGVLVQDMVPPPCDFSAPLLSLPYFLGTTCDTVPTPIPYLQVPPQPASAPGCKIGLAWASESPDLPERRISCPLPLLASLPDRPDTYFFSLQIGPAVEDIARHNLGEYFADIEGEIRDLADIAAIISQMDLVITVDNAIAHLAGALGKPVWILLSHIPDWRWLLQRSDSPWYPSARLFRQPKAGDWDSVTRQVKEAFAAFSPG